MSDPYSDAGWDSGAHFTSRRTGFDATPISSDVDPEYVEKLRKLKATADMFDGIAKSMDQRAQRTYGAQEPQPFKASLDSADAMIDALKARGTEMGYHNFFMSKRWPSRGKRG